MKKLKNWFIGDYLAKTDDVFERARIGLLYNYSLGFFLLGSVYYTDLIIHQLWWSTAATTFAMVSLFSIPFILKFTQSVRKAANWYVFQQTVMSILTIIIGQGKSPAVGVLWTLLSIICSLFLYGQKKGILVSGIYFLSTGITATFISLFPIDFKDPQVLPDPEMFFLPVSLNILVVWNFIKTRTAAEKQINEQKLLLEEKNKEVHDSITYAQRIQKAILPSQRMIEYSLPQSFIVYLPKDIVSGDFYWVEKKEETVFFAVIDCTGHGVPGAMMSVIGQNALNRVLNEFNITEPAKMLDKLNELIEASFAKSGADIRDGMDMALCSLNYQTLQLEFAGANNGMYHFSKGKLNELKGTKQPIGRFESKVPFTNHRIQLQKGDAVYLFSDGIADQFGGPQGKKFKYKRVKELLLANAAESPRIQKNNVLEAFSQWKGRLEQVDDVCLMGVIV